MRERLTELGLDFVAKQVEAEPEDQQAMRDATGTDVIPVFVLDDGTVLGGEAKEILRRLASASPSGRRAAGHRQKASRALRAGRLRGT